MSTLNPPSAPPVLLLDGDASYLPEIAAAGKSFGCKSFSQGPARRPGVASGLDVELILAAGLTRECEAKSGDAQ
jgi:hypothetical protein